MHTITAKMLDPSGNPLQGSATFTMAQIRTIGDNGEVYSGSVTAPVDRDGTVRVNLLDGDYIVTFKIWEPASGKMLNIPNAQIKVTRDATLAELMHPAAGPAARGVTPPTRPGELVVSEDTLNLLTGANH
jgi:hypothetical protein